MSSEMTMSIDPAMLVRLDELASERKMTREAIVQVALDDYLHAQMDDLPPWQDWQLEQIRDGLAAAERGEFASDEEVEQVFSKFRREG